MAAPSMRIQDKFYYPLLKIWELCGNERFLASYINENSDGWFTGALAHNLKTSGLIVDCGRPISHKTTRFWRIDANVSTKLTKRVGPADEQAEQACRKYTEEKLKELLNYRSISPTRRNSAELMATRKEQMNHALNVIRNNTLPGSSFTYSQIASHLKTRSTLLLVHMEKAGLVRRVGFNKPPGGHAKVVHWQEVR